MQRVAQERCEYKTSRGIPRKKVSPRIGSTQADYEALCAEWAVGALLGGDPDLSHFSGKDDGTDIVIPQLSVQVKLNHYEDGDLYLNEGEELKADVAVLVIPDGKYLRLAGWIDRDTFEASASTTDYGYGPRKYVAQSSLFGMNTLMRRLLNDNTHRIQKAA